MRKSILAMIAATSMVTAAALSHAAQPTPSADGFQPTPYFVMPLEKDATRQVRLQNVVIPPHKGNKFHRHPGDQWWAVQEGEVVFTIKGQAPRVLKPGDYVYVPRGTIHKNENMTDKPVRSIELNITDKDKPQTEQVPD
jgi:quercetin dioxygenase-like cupin family protein